MGNGIVPLDLGREENSGLWCFGWVKNLLTWFVFVFGGRLCLVVREEVVVDGSVLVDLNGLVCRY